MVGMAGPPVAELDDAVVGNEGNPRGLFFLGVGLAVSCKAGLEFFEFLTGTFLRGIVEIYLALSAC